MSGKTITFFLQGGTNVSATLDPNAKLVEIIDKAMEDEYILFDNLYINWDDVMSICIADTPLNH